MSKYIFDINYDSSNIKIYSIGKFNYSKGGSFLNTSFTKLLAQPLTIADKEKIIGNFYLDSGAGLCLLLSETFLKDNKFLLAKRKPVTTQVQGLGGKKQMRLTVIKSLKIGPYKFYRVPTNLYDDEINMLNYPYGNGLLGNDIMRRFNTVYNYAAKEVYITPNTHFTDKFDFAYTGMSIYDFDGKVYIDDIMPNSPATKGGLQNGDQIIAVSNIINGTVQQYENLLQKAKETIRILIVRKDKTLFLSIFPNRIR